MKITEYNTRLNEERLPIIAEKVKYNIDGRMRYTSPQAIASLIGEEVGLHYATDEHIYIVGFDTKNKVKGLFEISHGTINASISSPREIFRNLLMIDAVYFVICHNHPSGETEPSEADEKMTAQLAQCGQMMHMPLMDHIIVGSLGGSYYSFREHNKLQV